MIIFVIVVVLAAFAATFSLTKSIDKMSEENERELFTLGEKAGIFGFLVVLAAIILVVTALLGGLAGMIVSGIVIAILAIAQFGTYDWRQMKSLIVVSVPFALLFWRANAVRLATDWTNPASFLLAAVIPILTVILCGLISLLLSKGKELKAKKEKKAAAQSAQPAQPAQSSQQPTQPLPAVSAGTARPQQPAPKPTVNAATILTAIIAVIAVAVILIVILV